MKNLLLLESDWEGNEFLELAEASAGIGVGDMDLATGLVRARPQFFYQEIKDIPKRLW